MFTQMCTNVSGITVWVSKIKKKIIRKKSDPLFHRIDMSNEQTEISVYFQKVYLSAVKIIRCT